MITLQFIPNRELASLSQDTKIKKIISLVKEEKILLVEGKLTSEEESTLIKRTMEQITKRFKGIEIATYYHEPKNIQFIEKFRKTIAQFILGYEHGFTIIGPASLVREIKKDPNKVELFMKSKRR
ncbi:MAG: DUF2073 domain-containing protein [Nanoarchaeota archaeon]